MRIITGAARLAGLVLLGIGVTACVQNGFALHYLPIAAVGVAFGLVAEVVDHISCYATEDEKNV